MKASVYTLIIIIATCSSTLAQSYSGKFKKKPAISDFEQFIVTQDQKNGLQGVVVSVRAFDHSGNMWESKAVHAETQLISTVIDNFKGEKNIVSVYELKFKHGREKMDYFMFGYLDSENKERFLLVEEWFHGPQEVVPIEVNTFVWASNNSKR